MTGKKPVLKAKDWKQNEYKHLWPVQLSTDHHCAENYKVEARFYKEFSNRHHPTRITMKHLVYRTRQSKFKKKTEQSWPRTN